MARLSVIVPALDEAATIGACLAALAPLRTAGHEVIVVDGGSGDETAALARRGADAVVTAPRGRALQMNAGAALASGDVLLFLHADTRLPPDAAAAIASAIAQGSRWGRFDVSIDGRSRLLPVIGAMMNLRSSVTGIATGDQAIFVARDTFMHACGFPALPLMEDVALSKTLRRIAGAPARLRSRVVTSGRRWDSRGALATIGTMWRLRFDHWRGVDPAALALRYGAPPLQAAPLLLVFAKDPVPGRVKTRLAATLGADGAAAVYRELAERTLTAAAASRDAGGVGAVELWCDPDQDSPAFAAWRDRFGVTLHTQRGGDLGARMRHAVAQALARGRSALVIGTDCPEIDAAYVARAAAALRRNDVVVGPALDGGYVLVGLARDVDIFTGIAWSTPAVMAATRERVRTLGATMVELATLRDIDTSADLDRYRAAVSPPG
ncbi:MAG: TIGR04283 family arsenosugar biosynthesis glycosyltransferase [Casimicrobiaceae bacterium]